mmetsp:Transcript_18061/g.63902  ORF Transcript_18061/g.63902 Transcript_18061/m.63902 type:complete len:305 (-) Transcript_18061:1866-2780(-)
MCSVTRRHSGRPRPKPLAFVISACDGADASSECECVRPALDCPHDDSELSSATARLSMTKVEKPSSMRAGSDGPRGTPALSRATDFLNHWCSSSLARGGSSRPSCVRVDVEPSCEEEAHDSRLCAKEATSSSLLSSAMPSSSLPCLPFRPTPVLRTSSNSAVSSHSVVTMMEIVPSLVNLHALCTALPSPCRIRMGSMSSCSGSARETTVVSATSGRTESRSWCARSRTTECTLAPMISTSMSPASSLRMSRMSLTTCTICATDCCSRHSSSYMRPVMIGRWSSRNSVRPPEMWCSGLRSSWQM